MPFIIPEFQELIKVLDANEKRIKSGLSLFKFTHSLPASLRHICEASNHWSSTFDLLVPS